MPLSKEQLLIPRVKVIADYPGSQFEVDSVINVDAGDSEGNLYIQIEHDKAIIASNFPHIFQPLPWYAERAIDDMPEYIYWKHSDDLDGMCKVVRWIDNQTAIVKIVFDGDRFGREGQVSLNEHDYPADKTDYEAYINRKK